MSMDSNSSVIQDTVYVRGKMGVQEDSTSNIHSQTSRNPEWMNEFLKLI
jgi:hypothetical protein